MASQRSNADPGGPLYAPEATRIIAGMDWQLTLNFFIALTAVVDPIGNLPFFLSATRRDYPARQRLLAALAMAVTIILLILFFLAGEAILGFFGISLSAFRIAGGILLLLTGIQMVSGVARQLPHGDEDAAAPSLSERFGHIMVPIVVPLYVGPGSISVVILYSCDSSSWVELGALLGVIPVVGLLSFVILAAGGFIVRLIGETGLEVVTRILGLIVSAIAVQFILDGLNEGLQLTGAL